MIAAVELGTEEPSSLQDISKELETSKVKTKKKTGRVVASRFMDPRPKTVAKVGTLRYSRVKLLTLLCIKLFAILFSELYMTCTILFNSGRLVQFYLAMDDLYNLDSKGLKINIHINIHIIL